MRRSWLTILLILGLASLLVLIGGLQYRWLSRISESDAEKARGRVSDQAERFAMDFNREIQSAYFNFQTGAESWRQQDWTEFNERYDFWRERTVYPDLISDFYFFESKPEAAPLKYDVALRTFAATELNPELSELRSRVAGEEVFRPVYEDMFSMVLPIHHDIEYKAERLFIRSRTIELPPKTDAPKEYGYLVIKLDPATIKDKLLPDLTAEYFGDGEFRAAVTDRAGAQVFQSISGGPADATAPLFELKPYLSILYGSKDLMSKIVGEKQRDVMMYSRVESRTFNSVESNGNKQSSVKIEVKKDGIPRTPEFGTITKRPDGPWNLHVKHSSGSLAAFSASTLRRNLSLGFGLLFLLAAALAVVVFSAHRVRRLAQRQVDFVSSVSHEFRTPLAVIYSAGENLADGVAKEDVQVSRYGNLIKSEGKKLTGMVEQILDFAGANSGRKKYHFVQSPVDEIVRSAIDECQPLLDAEGMSVVKYISDSLPPIHADGRALSQAIQNLIVNSVKYSSGEKWLHVRAENGDATIKISVEDRGIGISKTDLRQIFEPFYRSREVVDAQIHGNGLGLSLVKQIAEAHGGRVFASSEIGKGSVFTIELPAV